MWRYVTVPQWFAVSEKQHDLQDVKQDLLFVFDATAPPSGPGPPHSRGFYEDHTHNNTPQSVGLLYTGDQLVAEAST
jgi:hypothetical protein